MAEEVLMEVEAVQAVYGDDCVVFDSFPPHLHVHIKPRTADISSEQFVEALIAIRASSKYPEETPHINLVDSKGLDQQRQKHLMACIQEKASIGKLCARPDFIEECVLGNLQKEAVEKLSIMNHPDGDCPLCLHPLVLEEEQNEKMPFMKLMSCFHCFHSECIIRWWNWIQKEKESNTDASSTLHSIRDRENHNVMDGVVGESMGSCPVCRKVFHTKDFEHVLGLVGLHPTELSCENSEIDRERLLECESEKIRRGKFGAILKLQEENGGLIEPKKDILVLPGMYLPQPVTQALNKEERESETDRGRCSSRGGSSSGQRRNQRIRNWRKPGRDGKKE